MATTIVASRTPIERRPPRCPPITGLTTILDGAMLIVNAMRARYLAEFLVAVLSVQSASPEMFWNGQSAGYQITWTRDNLKAVNGSGGAVLDVAARAKAEWASAKLRYVGRQLYFEPTYRLLSVVGPIVSVKQTNYWEFEGPHPSETKQFLAYDLRKSTPMKPYPANLSNYVAEQDLLDSLRADPILEEAIGDTGILTLDALWRKIEFKPVQSNGCPYDVSRKMLEHFAFYDWDGRQASVRIGLSHGDETCRGKLIQLGLKLPVNAALQSWLRSSKDGSRGRLMDRSKLDGDDTQRTTLKFSN